MFHGEKFKIITKLYFDLNQITYKLKKKTELNKFQIIFESIFQAIGFFGITNYQTMFLPTEVNNLKISNYDFDINEIKINVYNIKLDNDLIRYKAIVY